MANTDASFTGSIPEYYDKYLGPLLFEEYSIDIAKRMNVPSGGKVLEIAAGTGLASRHIRQAMPEDAQLTVTDLNDAMLNIARAKIGKAENVSFESADAQELPFEDKSFDSVLCQFGIMFFPDKQKGVDEAYRVLKAGGEYLFSVWDSYEHNPLIKLVNDTLMKLFPENPPPFLDVPLGYFKIDEIKEVLEKANFKGIEIDVLPEQIRTDDARNVANGFILGNPLSLQIPELGEDLDKVIDKITAEVIRTYGKDTIEASKQAIVFKAHKPI
jgi:ubiquinone/menaquinone biosynthesis C-methylase UbiE